MKIAFVSSMWSSPWGGSEVLWSQAASRLHAMGHEVYASVHGWPELAAPLKRLRSEGIRVEMRPAATQSLLRRVLVRSGVARPRDVDQESFLRMIADFGPDLVCVSQGAISCGLGWMERCINAAVPYAVISEANAVHLWPDDSYSDDLRRAWEGAKRGYFVSEGNRHLFGLQTCANLSNTEVVRNPFCVPFNSPPEWPRESSVYRLACVGRLDPESKGQDLLIELMASEIWRQRPVEVSFFGQGDYAETLRRLVVNLGLEDRLKFHGHVADVASIWSSHHALVLPSRFEGLPLVVVEAMLSDRICIVTDVAGNAELLDDGQTGFVAAAPTVVHLAEALERAWACRSQWREMGVEAGHSARRLLPRDPAQVFAERLLELCDS